MAVSMARDWSSDVCSSDLSVHRDQFPATYQPCTAILVKLRNIPAWTAKTRAIPSWHRDHFAAKVTGSARCLRRVTQPPFIAGPLCLKPKNTTQK
jgi:hypothetical protein